MREILNTCLTEMITAVDWLQRKPMAAEEWFSSLFMTSRGIGSQLSSKECFYLFLILNLNWIIFRMRRSLIRDELIRLQNQIIFSCVSLICGQTERQFSNNRLSFWINYYWILFFSIKMNSQSIVSSKRTEMKEINGFWVWLRCRASQSMLSFALISIKFINRWRKWFWYTRMNWILVIRIFFFCKNSKTKRKRKPLFDWIPEKHFTGLLIVRVFCLQVWASEPSIFVWSAVRAPAERRLQRSDRKSLDACGVLCWAEAVDSRIRRLFNRCALGHNSKEWFAKKQTIVY